MPYKNVRLSEFVSFSSSSEPKNRKGRPHIASCSKWFHASMHPRVSTSLVQGKVFFSFPQNIPPPFVSNQTPLTPNPPFQVFHGLILDRITVNPAESERKENTLPCTHSVNGLVFKECPPNNRQLWSIMVSSHYSSIQVLKDPTPQD